jgi:hypothetical protein
VTNEDKSLEFGMSMDQGTVYNTWLVPESQATAAVSAMKALGHNLELNAEGLRDRNGHIDCCYLGEIGWRDQGCYHRRHDPIRLVQNGTPLELTPTSEEYTWEATRFDCSIVDTTHLVTPSARLLASTQIKWDGNVGFRDAENCLVAAVARQLEGTGGSPVGWDRGAWVW